MKENARAPNSSIPMPTRLDHLDGIMKYLEGKQNLPKWDNSGPLRGADDTQSVPIELAVREGYFKGTIIDRVTSLEQRLFQLRLEMESRGGSSTPGTSSHSRASGYASSSQGWKSEPSSHSLPTFKAPTEGLKEVPILPPREPEIQEEPSPVENKKQRQGKHMQIEDDKTCKSGKKKMTSKWPHLKILGC